MRSEAESQHRVLRLKLAGVRRSGEMRTISLSGKNRASQRLVTKSIATRFNRV
jgi:hypothetical protein